MQDLARKKVISRKTLESPHQIECANSGPESPGKNIFFHEARSSIILKF